VPLPVSNDKGKTRGCSEIAFVGNDIFLALSRDGDGRGGDDTKSKYKYVLVPHSCSLNQSVLMRIGMKASRSILYCESNQHCRN